MSEQQDDPVLEALRDELDELRDMVEGLDESDWSRPSACEGWSVADVVLHLAQTDELATASALGRSDAAEAIDWAGSGSEADDAAGAAVDAQRGVSGAEVLRRWARSSDAMVEALGSGSLDRRVLWLVGDMSARSLATTRITETWIHTDDVAVGLGVEHPPTDRLWHIARLAHRTLPYAFSREGLPAPEGAVFVLEPPGGGEPWVFGDPADARTVVRGPALDLCRVAGQRAIAADTALTAEGPQAAEVLALVRTFA